MNTPTNEPERYGWTVEDWSRAAGCGRSTTWLLIKDKRLRTASLGRRRVILDHPRDFLERAAAEQRQAA